MHIYVHTNACVHTHTHTHTHSSKHGGLAGTRFGWGFVQDKAVADAMIQVVEGIMLSYSIDAQLRVLSGLKVVLGETRCKPLRYTCILSTM